MDSNIIKTYLLDLLFDLMEHPKFRQLSHACHETGLLELRDGVAACLSRVSGELDAKVADSRLYTEIYDRWGELAPRVVGRAAKAALQEFSSHLYQGSRAEMCYSL